MSNFTPGQRLQFLEKARKRKEQPEKKVDVLSQLDVGEGDRKKRKGGDSRISIPVKTSGPSHTIGEQVVNVDEEVKSLSKKKSRTLSRKSKRDRDVVDVDKDLVEVEDQTLEASLVVEQIVAGASQGS
jgi:hypothetical protein